MILVYKSTSSVDNVANDEIKDKLKQRSYKYNLLKSIEIPKPSHGVRNLGVECGRARQISYAINS